jgi:hypothetical protein
VTNFGASRHYHGARIQETLASIGNLSSTNSTHSLGSLKESAAQFCKATLFHASSTVHVFAASSNSATRVLSAATSASNSASRPLAGKSGGGTYGCRERDREERVRASNGSQAQRTGLGGTQAPAIRPWASSTAGTGTLNTIRPQHVHIVPSQGAPPKHRP